MLSTSRLSLLLCLVASTASAQLTEVQPGSRVRVVAPGIVAERYVGTVLSRDADTVVVAAANTTPVRVPISRITALEISRGKSRIEGAKRGIMWGVPIGLAGGLLTYAVSPDCVNCKLTEDLNPHSAAFVGWAVASGVFYGAGIGAWIGREKWDRFDGVARAAFRMRGDRAQLGVALEF